MQPPGREHAGEPLPDRCLGRKDASPVGQLHRHHPVRWMQQIVQHRWAGRSSKATCRERNRCQLRCLLAVKPNWTRQRNTMLVTMRWRRQTSATLMPGCSDSNTTASFSSFVKLRRFERPSCGGSASRAAVKSFSARAILSSAASTSAYLRAGTRMKMRPPVDLHLGVLETVPPFAQRVGRKPQAGGVFANTHPGPIHGFHMHRPERLERTRAGVRAHGIARSLRPLATLPLLPALLLPTRNTAGISHVRGLLLADQMLDRAFERLGDSRAGGNNPRAPFRFDAMSRRATTNKGCALLPRIEMPPEILPCTRELDLER